MRAITTMKITPRTEPQTIAPRVPLLQRITSGNIEIKNTVEDTLTNMKENTVFLHMSTPALVNFEISVPSAHFRLILLSVYLENNHF